MKRPQRRQALIAIVWYVAAIPALLSFGYARTAGGGKRDEALQTVARAERFFPGTGRAVGIK